MTLALEESRPLEELSSMSKRFAFVNAVSALCYTIVDDEPPTDMDRGRCTTSVNAVVNFVVAQHGRMPDYLRAPLFLLTVLFNLAGLWHARTPFHRQLPVDRRRQIAAWRRSRFRVARDFVRLYESLVLFSWYSMLTAHVEPDVPRLASDWR
jgi:NAD(P)-dependent dehydrogenase (short-subunit alcohol dehydrogenase family)